MPVIANLIIGIDGATTIDGRSSPLSTPADRRRFHELRKRSRAIMIGGATARAEPYESTPLPLIVVTRARIISGRAAENPLAIIATLSIESAIEKYSGRYDPLLIEAGGNFLLQAMQGGFVDELYVTRVSKIGGAPYFTTDPLALNFELLTESGAGDELFSHYARLP